MIKFLWIALTATLMADIGILESLKTRAIGEGGERVTLEINNNDAGKKRGGTGLNLPEKFDVKASVIFFHEAKESDIPIFHFVKDNFWLEKELIGKSGILAVYKSSGTFTNGILQGKMTARWHHLQKGKRISKLVITYVLTGQVDNNGRLSITQKEIKAQGYAGGPKKWFPNPGWENRKGVDFDYILQLPINQSQSSQTFIKDSKEEPKPTQKAPQTTTIPKANLSVDLSVNKETQEEIQEEAYLDEAMIEYRKKEKERIAREKVEDREDLAREKAQEAQEKADKKHQAMLDKWYEEDRQDNIKHNKELEKGNKKREDVEKQENQAFHDKIANEQKERKAKQAEIKKAHDIVDRFGDGDYESQRLSHKKIEELSKNADSEKASKIKNAMRKQYYDSRQTKLQGEAEYQTSKAKEIDKKGKYVKSIKDTSLTINKILAKLDPTGTGDKIVSAMENTYTAIEGHEKGGWGGAVDNLIEKKASDMSGGWSDTVKEEIETYQNFQRGDDITLKKSEHYYDKDKNRLTKVKKGQKLYDKDDNEITFSFRKRIFKNTIKKLNDDHNAINTAATKVEEIKEGVVTGDFNKAVNAGLDAMDAKDSIDDRTDGVVRKLENISGGER